MNESPNGSELRDLACLDIQVDLSASTSTEQQCRAEEKVWALMYICLEVTSGRVSSIGSILLRSQSTLTNDKAKVSIEVKLLSILLDCDSGTQCCRSYTSV